MVAVISALKWLAKFLERRFPARVNSPVPMEMYQRDKDAFCETDAVQAKQIEALQKQIELLNLRVGLARPIQTVIGRKV